MPEPSADDSSPIKVPLTRRGRHGNASRARRVQVPARNAAVLVGAFAGVTMLAGVAVAVFAVVPGSSGGSVASASFVPTVHGDRVTGSTAVPGPMPGAPSSPAAAVAVAAAAGTPGATSTKAAAPVGPKPLLPANAAQVMSWNKGSGGTALSAVTVASGNVMMAHASAMYPEMLQACRVLTTAIQQASAGAPIPDTAMQHEYTAALSAFRQGAVDCEAGITQHIDGPEDTVTNVNQADVNSAVASISVGLSKLYIATEVLRKQ